MSGTTTRAPSGRAVTTAPISSDTVAPTATCATGTPASRANEARAASVVSPQPSQLVRPACQSARAL